MINELMSDEQMSNERMSDSLRKPMSEFPALPSTACLGFNIYIFRLKHLTQTMLKEAGIG